MADSGWQIRMSNSRAVPYFYHAETQASAWDKPPGLSDADVRALPGYEKHIGGGADAGGGASARPARVRASHLLVKHAGSRRPSSWKEANITRSKADAIGILRGYETQIGGDGDAFGALAQEHSDCSSHAQAGDLGWFGPGQMQKPFEDATYALGVGEISGVVETDSGVHLIMRTG